MSASGQKRPPEGGDDGGGKRPAVASPDDEENVCWLCLDAVHESGLPLRRDCSCRGGSGFAHLPCIVKHAKDWSQRHEGDEERFAEAWKECHNCHQRYQDDLARDLTDELISFVRSNYAGNRMEHLFALERKLRLMDGDDVDGIKDTSIKILCAIIEYMRETQPPVPKCVYQIEARAYRGLGYAYLCAGTKENASTAVEYYETRLGLAKAHNLPHGEVSSAEVDLARAKSKCEGAVFKKNEEMLKGMQQRYKEIVKRNGQEAVITINYGTKYAKDLKNQAYRGIEAERLLEKLAAISNRVHGPDHKTTKSTLEALALCKRRKVKVKSGQAEGMFDALRYEDEGEKCVVQGPVASPRKPEDEGIMSVSRNDIVAITKGDPVICSGLKEKANLNGKIGDVRGKDEASGCYKVHFEEKGLGGHLVPLKCIRIVFDLPPVEPSVGNDASPQNGESA